jgi:hypothetical protein
MFLRIENLTLQRRFPLKYVNLCKILHKLYLQLMENRAQVKAFNALELSPYSSIMYSVEMAWGCIA